MLYTEFVAGGKEYKLRLTTRNIIALEKSIGCNPLMLFGGGDRIPTITEMVAVLHSALQSYQHNIALNDAFDIFDAFLGDGNGITDFIPIMIDIYKISGLIADQSKAEQEKN